MMTSPGSGRRTAQPGRACRAYAHHANTALTRDYGMIAPHARTISNGGFAIAAAGYGIAGRQPSAGGVSAGAETSRP